MDIWTKSRTKGSYGEGEHQAFLPNIPLREYKGAHKSSIRCQQRSHQALVVFLICFIFVNELQPISPIYFLAR